MYEIRRALPKDALGITIVNGFAWKMAYTGLVAEELINRRIEELLPRSEKTRLCLEQGEDCFVAVDGDTVVGFCLLGPERDTDMPARGEIYALYVLPGYQRQGVGKALLITAMDSLKAAGMVKVIIHCLSGNAAIGFYQHLGGQVIGQWDDASSGFRLHGDSFLFNIALD